MRMNRKIMSLSFISSGLGTYNPLSDMGLADVPFLGMDISKIGDYLTVSV